MRHLGHSRIGRTLGSYSFVCHQLNSNPYDQGSNAFTEGFLARGARDPRRLLHVARRDFSFRDRCRGCFAGCIAREARRTRVRRVGGEPDLIVGDEVNRAADAIALEHRHVQRLGHHPFAREGRVAVDDDRKDLGLLAA